MGSIIRTSEIRPLNPSSTSSLDRISYSDMIQYDVNRDPKVQASTFLHAFSAGLTNIDLHVKPTTKINASITHWVHTMYPSAP
jgi:hypothetical protein